MKIAVRLDDITSDMNFEKFNRVKDILDAAGIKPLIGVVPFCKDDTLRIDQPIEDFEGFLKGLLDQGWLVALHGYNHLYTSKTKGLFPLNNFSEFAGVDYDRQYMMIKEGLEQLSSLGVKTEVFMAPGHTFDKNTLKALKENGISKVTDGFGDCPFEQDGMTFYPILKKRSECTSDKVAYSTYVLHTNTMSDEGIESFEKLISNNRDNFISYDEYLKVPAKKRRSAERLLFYIMALAKHYLVGRRASKGTVIHKN